MKPKALLACVSLTVFLLFGSACAPVSHVSPPSRFPLHWRIGSIDPRFGIRESQVLAVIDRDIKMWENAAHKKLFEYDSVDGFPISLVYDVRQETIETRERYREQLANSKALVANSLQKAQQAANQFSEAKQRFAQAQNALAVRLQSYNQRVAYWNSMGGAPEAEASALNTEKDNLDAERVRIESFQADLQVLADQAKSLSSAYYGQVASYNLAVRDYNEQFGPGHTQTVGECLIRGDHIEALNVYAFANSADLTIVLAHELGHAIGIAHVKGEGAIMSAVESGERYATHLRLTDRDKEALKAALKKNQVILESP